MKRVSIVLFLLGMLAACGDVGMQGMQEDDGNEGVVAIIDAPVMVKVGERFMLDASDSNSSSGDSLTFQWSVAEEPAAESVEVISSSGPTLIAMASEEGPIRFRLTVSDRNSSDVIEYEMFAVGEKHENQLPPPAGAEEIEEGEVVSTGGGGSEGRSGGGNSDGAGDGGAPSGSEGDSGEIGGDNDSESDSGSDSGSVDNPEGYADGENDSSMPESGESDDGPEDTVSDEEMGDAYSEDGNESDGSGTGNDEGTEGDFASGAGEGGSGEGQGDETGECN